MRALVLDEHGASVSDRPEPEARPDWAVVRVAVAGICNTDLELVRGYMGFRGVLGHEFTGTVEAGPPDWIGQRVVAEINFACQTCGWCHRGLQRHCPHRQVLGIADADGAFAERVAVPVANLHVVPGRVPDDAAVFAEPLAAAFEILEQLHLEPGVRCIVFGDGKLGLLVAQVLDAAGALVTAVGKHEDNLKVLAMRGIETYRLDSFPERAAPVVVDATGSAAGFGRALAATEPRGTLVLKSTVADRFAADLAPIVINEIRVLGSRCGPFEPALRALARNLINVAPLVSDRYPLARGVDGLERASEPGIRKIILDIGA